jgi:transcriptional regulator with XRE-family HTH domain
VVGERLKKLRRDRKISQEDLSKIIGVQSSSVSRYEKGKDDPSDKVKAAIVKYFNVSLDYLLGIIDEPVEYYDQDKFLRLPDWITKDEKIMLMDFIGYLEYRKDKRSDA